MSKPDDDDAELDTEEAVRVKLILSGEREKLKRAAKEKLEQAGWTDELRQQCRDFAARCGPEALTHEALVAETRPAALSQIPDHIKADILKEIRSAIVDS